VGDQRTRNEKRKGWVWTGISMSSKSSFFVFAYRGFLLGRISSRLHTPPPLLYALYSDEQSTNANMYILQSFYLPHPICLSISPSELHSTASPLPNSPLSNSSPQIFSLARCSIKLQPARLPFITAGTKIAT
jgi:hypothetical protein